MGCGEVATPCCHSVISFTRIKAWSITHGTFSWLSPRIGIDLSAYLSLAKLSHMAAGKDGGKCSLHVCLERRENGFWSAAFSHYHFLKFVFSSGIVDLQC